MGFEPTRIAPPELESGALDRSAKLSCLDFISDPRTMNHRGKIRNIFKAEEGDLSVEKPL